MRRATSELSNAMLRTEDRTLRELEASRKISIKMQRELENVPKHVGTRQKTSASVGDPEKTVAVAHTIPAKDADLTTLALGSALFCAMTLSMVVLPKATSVKHEEKLGFQGPYRIETTPAEASEYSNRWGRSAIVVTYTLGLVISCAAARALWITRRPLGRIDDRRVVHSDVKNTALISDEANRTARHDDSGEHNECQVPSTILELLRDKNFSLRSYRSVVEELLLLLGKRTISAAQQFRRLLSKDLQCYRFLIQIQETICRGPAAALTNTFDFEDALGRSMRLDYQYFRHWEVFAALLKCEFRGLPGERHVLDDHFLVMDNRSTNRIIDRNIWDRAIFPRSRIKMSIVLEVVNAATQGRCPRFSCKGFSTKSHFLGTDHWHWYCNFLRIAGFADFQ